MPEQQFDFADIYTAFYPKIRRYLTLKVSEQEAEDLTQTVFVKLSQGLKDFRKESSLSTWVYRIATNVAIDRLNTPSFRQSVQERELSETTKEEQEADFWTGEKPTSIEQQLIRREMNGCIRDVVDRLPENYRTVVVLSELDGLKNQEIAGILGTSLEAVKVRLHRGRGMMRKNLEAKCNFSRDERNELVCDLKHCP